MIIQSSLFALACLSADAAYPPVYVCPKVTSAPIIDGSLDDPAWARSPAISLVSAVDGNPITKTTTARMCWDDHCLYIAFECADTDIWGTYTKRDDEVFLEEVVEAFIDPDRDLVRYFEINVSPRNTVFDALIVNPDGWSPGEGTDHAWNCEGLLTAVKVDGTLDDRTDIDRGWTAELAVPFSGLGVETPRPGKHWRLNLYRIDLDPEPAEFQAWSPTMADPARFHVPSRFGTVLFSNAE